MRLGCLEFSRPLNTRKLSKSIWASHHYSINLSDSVFARHLLLHAEHLVVKEIEYQFSWIQFNEGDILIVCDSLINDQL